MKLSNEELNKIMMKADDDLDRLKDRCHELYEENKELKDKCNMYEMNMYREENEKNNYKRIINKAIELLKLKQIRYDNEVDYALNDNDLLEVIDVLEGDGK